MLLSSGTAAAPAHQVHTTSAMHGGYAWHFWLSHGVHISLPIPCLFCSLQSTVAKVARKGGAHAGAQTAPTKEAGVSHWLCPLRRSLA
jgi:hypothetical protein